MKKGIKMMPLKFYLMIFLGLFSATVARAEISQFEADATTTDEPVNLQFSASDNDTNVQNQQIEATNASGEQSTTIVDEGGNLRVKNGTSPSSISTNPALGAPSGTQITPPKPYQDQIKPSGTMPMPNNIPTPGGPIPSPFGPQNPAAQTMQPQAQIPVPGQTFAPNLPQSAPPTTLPNQILTPTEIVRPKPVYPTQPQIQAEPMQTPPNQAPTPSEKPQFNQPQPPVSEPLQRNFPMQPGPVIQQQPLPQAAPNR